MAGYQAVGCYHYPVSGMVRQVARDGFDPIEAPRKSRAVATARGKRGDATHSPSTQNFGPRCRRVAPHLRLSIEPARRGTREPLSDARLSARSEASHGIDWRRKSDASDLSKLHLAIGSSQIPSCIASPTSLDYETGLSLGETGGGIISRDYSIDIVVKALELLGLFDFQEPRLSLDQLAERLAISKTRAFRIAQTMLAEQYLKWDAGARTYELGPACMRLALVARTGNRLKVAALETMTALHRETQETVNLALIRNRRLYYAVILESPRAFRVSEHEGDPVPFENTSLGRAFLAAVPSPDDYVDSTTHVSLADTLAAVRRDGYAVDDEESVAGVRCVGVAIPNVTGGQVIGALSVSGPSSRMDDERVRVLGRRLQEAVGGLYEGLREAPQHGH